MEESVQNQIARLATLKLKPYKKFIKALLKIEEQGLVFEKDYRKLRGLFQGQIALYMKHECAESITTHLMAIGSCVGRGNESSRLREELRTPVLAIVNLLMENMGFGGKLDETFIKDMERIEDAFFPQLFRQAVKEALDNVLVNFSDYCLLNRGVYEQKEDGEYLVFSFINDHPHGCKIMIGPFTNKPKANILFQLFIPQYVHKGIKNTPSLPESETKFDNHSYRRYSVRLLSSYIVEERYRKTMIDMVQGWEVPINISSPLNDTCLIELEQEDCYNAYIPSFSFDDRDSCAPYRRNYAEIAFALGQRVKYIYLHDMVAPEPIYLPEYIVGLAEMRGLYPYSSLPVILDENGDLVF